MKAKQMKEEKMTEAECKVETQKHIEVVRKYIRNFVDRLTTRGVEHDKAKLESPEVELFTKYTPKLATMQPTDTTPSILNTV